MKTVPVKWAIVTVVVVGLCIANYLRYQSLRITIDPLEGMHGSFVEIGGTHSGPAFVQEQPLAGGGICLVIGLNDDGTGGMSGPCLVLASLPGSDRLTAWVDEFSDVSIQDSEVGIVDAAGVKDSGETGSVTVTSAGLGGPVRGRIEVNSEDLVSEGVIRCRFDLEVFPLPSKQLITMRGEFTFTRH